jgi:hypothetical protein
MIISNHARDEMHQAGISEDDVAQCLEHGELEITQVVKGETRYGKKLDLKDKTIMVIYAFPNNEERIITAYTIRRKKWQG